MKKYIYYLTLGIFLIDQCLKQIILNQLKALPLTVIPSFFTIRYVENTGGAWGILNQNTYLLTVLSALVMILLNRYLLKEKEVTRLEVGAYGLFMGGLLGNFVDRIIYGHVIDYLDFKLFSYDYPVFNFADIALVIGVLLLIIDMVRRDKNENRRRKQSSEAA